MFSSGVPIYAFYAMQPYLLELYGRADYTIAGLAAALTARPDPRLLGMSSAGVGARGMARRGAGRPAAIGRGTVQSVCAQ